MCVRVQGATHELMVLKAEIVALKKDVDNLKYTIMSMTFKTMEIPDYLDTNISIYSDVPSVTTRDKVRADEMAAESEGEIDEEKIGV